MRKYKRICEECQEVQWLTGVPRAQICRPCKAKFYPPRKGTGMGQRVDANGYVTIMLNGKSVYQHRYIMEQFVGRKLTTKEHVHHLNHNPKDNRIENLELISASDHGKKHMTSEVAKQKSILAHKKRWEKKHAPDV